MKYILKIILFITLLFICNLMMMLLCSFIEWRMMYLQDFDETGRLFILVFNVFFLIPIISRIIKRIEL